MMPFDHHNLDGEYHGVEVVGNDAFGEITIHVQSTGFTFFDRVGAL